MLFADRARPDAGLLVLSAIFCLLYLAAGIGWQLRSESERLDALASTLVVGSAGLAFYSAQALFQNGGPRDRGIDLLACAAVVRSDRHRTSTSAAVAHLGNAR